MYMSLASFKHEDPSYCIPLLYIQIGPRLYMYIGAHAFFCSKFSVWSLYFTHDLCSEGKLIKNEKDLLKN